MTFAKVMDVIARQPDCEGQAADAVSAYTQLKLEDAPRLLKIQKLECPDVWIRLPRHKRSKSWANMEVPVVLLERNLYGHPLAGLLWERQFNWNVNGRSTELGESICSSKKQGLFLSVYVDDIKMAGKKQNMAPMWKNLMKNVDLGNTTSFLDHENMGRTQRECKPNEIIIEQYKETFESRISAGHLRSYQVGKNLTQKLLRGPTTWQDMLKNALRDTANWRTKRQSSCTKFHVLAWMIFNSRRRSLNQLEKMKSMLTNCIEMLVPGTNLKTSHSVVNKIARAVTKWTQACDTRLARLISYIHHASDCRQHCHVGNTAQLCRLGLFQDSDVAGDLWRLKINLGGDLMHFWKPNICPH